MKKLIKQAFVGSQSLFGEGTRNSHVNVIAPGISDAHKHELRNRIRYYMPACANDIRFFNDLAYSFIISPAPILLFGTSRAALGTGQATRLHKGIFDVDFRTNPTDGWQWIEAGDYVNGYAADLEKARSTLLEFKHRLTQEGYQRCYVFGTGPSLEKAITGNWDDGIRIVCNTIVRDPELWHHISPHIFVAGDAIYHFGCTKFALEFRKDLRKRLDESDVLFFYPSLFDRVIRDEFADLGDRLVPIPTGVHMTVHDDFSLNYSTPALGNVLNKLLLPLACNLSKTVNLWGFDGRAPADKLFWANSLKQSYTELLPFLQEAHPAFFDNFVPKDDPEKYVRSVHGDVLEHCLSSAEKEGWKFEILHHSWTDTLAKRSCPDHKNYLAT
jgi:hypothetical protein